MDSIGPYPIQSRLGSGSFATVWLCRDELLDAPVAVKVLADNWSFDPDVRNRFLEEARILRRLEDEHIVRVHALGELPDGRPYFVMEYAAGGSLEDRMRAGPMSVDIAVEVSLGIARGLTVAHREGVVHRDLKPSNVLFRRASGPNATLPVLADFGIARRLGSSRTATITAGTPHYVAPEQADPTAAGRTDGRADIYSAAAILYEMLAGRVPFPYDSLTQVLAAQLREPPPALRMSNPAITPALDHVVARGLSATPDQRPPTAEAWAAEVEGAHRGAATPPTSLARPRVPPTPPPPLPHAPHPAAPRRRRWLVLAAAVVLILAVAAVLVFVLNGGGDEESHGPANLVSPGGFAVAGDATLLIPESDNNRVVAVSPSGVVTVVVGTGERGLDGDGQHASSAKLAGPAAVALGDDALWISDNGNGRLRKVDSSGVITTGGRLSKDDFVVALAVDPSGIVYASTGHSIVRFASDADSEPLVVAGTGEAGSSGDGLAADSSIDAAGLDIGPDGALYLAEPASHRVRVVKPNGTIATVAGTGESGWDGDGGPATHALLSSPKDVAVDESGNLYIADAGNGLVRKVSPDGIITTVAGNMETTATGDGVDATSVVLSKPERVEVGSDGSVYVLEVKFNRVRRIGPDGKISTVA